MPINSLRFSWSQLRHTHELQLYHGLLPLSRKDLQATHTHELQPVRGRNRTTKTDLQATHTTHELQPPSNWLLPSRLYLQATHTHELQPGRPAMDMSREVLQATHTHELQPAAYDIITGVSESFKPRIRMSCNCKNAQYSGSCTDYYVHILTFSSVLPARKERDLQPLSRFRDGKSPPILCEPAGFPCSLRLRTECFCDDFIDSLSGNIL